MDKFEIIKKHIDEYDYYSLLACNAPKDEFDRYSKILAENITEIDSVENIAILISNLLDTAFGEECRPKNFLETARRIKGDLKNCQR